jgi:glutathione S-transferase
MIKLYFEPATVTMVPHMLLEELQVAYETVRVSLEAHENRQPAFLKLNPNGLLPVLIDGDLVLYETAAIILHLCDMHPEAGLVPPLASAERAHFYKWLAWMTNTLQTTLVIYFHPDHWATDGDALSEVKLRAERKISGLLDQLEAELHRHGQSWFAGPQFSALDPYVFTLCRWTRNFANEPPARDRQRLGEYLQRMLRRPAVERVLSEEGVMPPFV